MRRIGLCLVALTLYAGALGRDAVDRWVAATDLPPLSVETSVEMQDRNGTLLRAYTVADGRWRLPVSLDAVDPSYLDMLVAYEDKRFFGHSGVDPWAVLPAVAQAVWNGRVVSGGSTLTMQVARLLEDGPTGTFSGKLRQVRVALALERQLTKQDILMLYVNRAPFGGNLEGLRSATRAYFGKDPDRLTPSQSALLVALPQSPELRRPDRYRGRAHDTRNRVLARVLGANVIDAEAAETAMVQSVPSQRLRFPSLAPHLTDALRQKVSDIGLHRMTLDAKLQAALEDLAVRAVRDAGNRISIAMLVADHRTGDILASVGSAGYAQGDRDGFIDMTRAIRSPGSTLKPLVYGLAFDRGVAHPETLIEDRPVSFDGYEPQNFDGEFRGTIRLREALKQSLNIPVVKLTNAIGPARLMSHLRRSGATPKLAGGVPGLAVSLGGVGVSLHDLVQLYAGIAAGGLAVTLHEAMDQAESGGANRIMSSEAAWMVGDILSEISPPAGAQRNGLAYKTGTSYGHRDAWAIGFDGKHSIGVWMGRPDGTPVPGAFGGDLAAPVLFEAFALLKPTIDRLPPPPPGTLLVGHAQLPKPLQRFRGDVALGGGADELQLVFPPDGARLSLDQPELSVRVRSGAAPFTWLADGKPVLTRAFERAAVLPISGPGFVTLSVIDASGRAARSRIQLD